MGAREFPTHESTVDQVHATGRLGLPLPRIQMTWLRGDRTPDDAGRYTWFCRYDLIVPIADLDIRNDGHKSGMAVAPLGLTRTGYGRDRTPVEESGRLDTPFRDGAHAKWDAIRLGWPAFVVYGDIAERIDPYSRS